jgi:hypothetical protein
MARIVVEHLEGIGLSYPKTTIDIERIRREYPGAKRAAGS